MVHSWAVQITIGTATSDAEAEAVVKPSPGITNHTIRDKHYKSNLRKTCRDRVICDAGQHDALW